MPYRKPQRALRIEKFFLLSRKFYLGFRSLDFEIYLEFGAWNLEFQSGQVLNAATSKRYGPTFLNQLKDSISAPKIISKTPCRRWGINTTNFCETPSFPAASFDFTRKV